MAQIVERNVEDWAVLTPRVGGVRVSLEVPASFVRVLPRGRAWSRTVTARDGMRWRVRGASCGLPGCFCDAVAKRVGKEVL